jgi:hypothetical protein
MADTTVGQRNYNYLNVKNNPANPWQGLQGVDEHGHTIFISPAYGLRAAILTLRTYWFSYGLHAVEGIVARWAPADDTIGSIAGGQPNNPLDYTNFVCQRIRMGPTQDLELFRSDKTFGNLENLELLIDAMAQFENGADFTFPRQQFLEALQLVQTGFDTSNLPLPTGKTEAAPAHATTGDALEPTAEPTEPADPLRGLSGPVLGQLKQTSAYQLIEILVTKPLPPPVPLEKPVDDASAALPAGEFVVSGHLLERLMAINSFPRNQGDQLIFFGLRGCLPLDWPNAPPSFAPSQTLKLMEINYENPRCTIGQWNTEKDTLVVFPGSTVPTLKYVVEAEKQGGAGANQLMTGYYLFKKGIHRAGQPSGHPAFIQLGSRACRRTADNEVAVYQPTDLVSEVDDDNLHAAFGDTLDGTYSSAGCQVVLGHPQCQQFKDAPPWPIFRDAAYNIDQQQFSYILLDGVQVAQIAKDPDAQTALLVRSGSVESALPQGSQDLIRKLQTALNQGGFYKGNPDGQFGAETAEAVAKFQKAKVGAIYVDTVVGSQTGKALLQSNGDWPTL